MRGLGSLGLIELIPGSGRYVFCFRPLAGIRVFGTGTRGIEVLRLNKVSVPLRGLGSLGPPQGFITARIRTRVSVPLRGLGSLGLS